MRDPDPTAYARPRCASFVSPHERSWSTFWWLLIPTAAFLAFLAFTLKPSLRKLRRSGSDVLLTYFTFVWSLALLQGLRVLVQLLPAEGTWTVCWLLTRAGGCLTECARF